MKFDFTKIIIPLDLAEYHESYAGKFLQVWVNPPREKRLEREEILREYSSELRKIFAPALETPPPTPPLKGRGADQRKKKTLEKTKEIMERDLTEPEQKLTDQLTRRMMVWLIELWNQHPDIESRWSLDEVIVVYETDPAFYQWLTRRTIEMMSDFRDGQKKALKPQ